VAGVGQFAIPRTGRFRPRAPTFAMKPLVVPTLAPPRASDCAPLEVPSHPADIVIAVVLGLAAIVSPLFLGCSFAVARFALEATLAAVIVIWACDRRRSPGVLLLPLGLFGLIWLQLLPLPDSLLVRLAPISGGAWKVAQAGGAGAWGRMSIDPAATAAGARRLLLGVASVLVVRDIAANAGIRRGLAAALAVSGAVIWALGLAFPRDTQDDLLLGLVELKGPVYGYVSALVAPVESAGSAYVSPVVIGRWQYPVADGHIGDGFGPFVGSNQFAGAMCLTLPLLLAFWLTVARAKLPAWVGVMGAALIGAVAVWTVGIRAGSRAGGVALMLGCMMFLMLAAQKRWWRWTLVVIAAVSLTAIATLTAAAFGLIPGFATLVPERLRPMLVGMLTDSRSIGFLVGMRMVRASLLAGTGLGSYAHLFPRFESSRGTNYYAHNDYVQWIAETGLLGGLVAAVIAFVFARRGITWLRAQQGERRILAAGAAAAAFGFASHEFFEWNLHLPAIALMAAIVAGIAAPTASGGIPRPVTAATATLRTRLRLLATVALVAAVAGATGFLARDMMTERAVRQLRTALAADRLPMLFPQQHAPPPTAEIKTSIAAGTAAIRWDPANADLPLLLGQLHLHLAARAADGAGRDALERSAEEWLTKARRRRAICFGLPELVPPPKPPAMRNGSRPLAP
jgi:hypothetical protein